MASQLDVLTGELPPDPDAQATVTDFLDYTEYLPSDLVRSLTLIGKLDESYLECTDQVHDLTKTYGSLPSIPPTKRPNAQHLRQEISYHLDQAINARESAYAEASRLYDAVDRHSSRLTSIISKLNALPKPPSRILPQRLRPGHLRLRVGKRPSREQKGPQGSPYMVHDLYHLRPRRLNAHGSGVVRSLFLVKSCRRQIQTLHLP